MVMMLVVRLAVHLDSHNWLQIKQPPQRQTRSLHSVIVAAYHSLVSWVLQYQVLVLPCAHVFVFFHLFFLFPSFYPFSSSRASISGCMATSRAVAQCSLWPCWASLARRQTLLMPWTHIVHSGSLQRTGHTAAATIAAQVRNPRGVSVYM